MLDIFSTYATDEKKEIEGVEVDLGGGASITVAREGNPNYSRALLAESEKYAQTLDDLKETDPIGYAKLDNEIMCRVYADTILLGFKGISWQGSELKYNKANALKVLALKDFRARVSTEAKKIDHYRAQFERVAGKN